MFTVTDLHGTVRGDALGIGSEYRSGMAEANRIDFNKPAPLSEEEDEATLAAIDRGIKDADEGRTVPLEEVRKMIPEWISKFESRRRR